MDKTDLPELPETEWLLARPARPYVIEYVTSFDGYSDDDMRSYALTAIATERARADALRAELGESDAVRERLAELLKQTAVALRGEPPPLTSWSWHDVPERAAAAIAAIDVMQRAASINAERADALEAALLHTLRMEELTDSDKAVIRALLEKKT